jgi:hypothetical protein
MPGGWSKFRPKINNLHSLQFITYILVQQFYLVESYSLGDQALGVPLDGEEHHYLLMETTDTCKTIWRIEELSKVYDRKVLLGGNG